RGLYPVHLQAFRCTWNQLRTSSRVGFLCSSRRALADMMNPAVQNPHWAPPYAIQETCSGCRFSAVPIPSIVVISALSGTVVILTVHDLMSLPLIITEQAPHCPCAHPTLQPVRSSCCRSTSASDFSGSTIIERLMPLTLKIVLFIGVPP